MFFSCSFKIRYVTKVSHQILTQWFTAFPTLLPFNTVPRVVIIPNSKIIHVWTTTVDYVVLSYQSPGGRKSKCPALIYRPMTFMPTASEVPTKGQVDPAHMDPPGGKFLSQFHFTFSYVCKNTSKLILPQIVKMRSI